jgi:hypothetical protein
MSPRTRTELWAWAKRDEMGGGGGSGSVTCETVRQRVAFGGVGVIFCDAWKADHEGQEG